VALPVPDFRASPVVVRAGHSTVVTAEPVEVVEARGPDALAALDSLESGWWAGYLAYDLGRAVERVIPRSATGDGHSDGDSLPDLLLARFDARAVVSEGQPHFVGSARGQARLRDLLEAAPDPSDAGPLGPARSSLDQDEFETGVRAIVELIEAGDCYQVNLTRQLTWDRPVESGGLFAELCARSPAPHAALMTLPRYTDATRSSVTVVSASPERFLSWNGRDVQTRPIKGTARDSAWLQASAKDRAENVMIVDLARNDLGRVCEFGSVHVPELCVVETHPGLHHLVSTIEGRLRGDVGVGDLIRATFPPASVTGAPKPRVMQAIEDLEPVRRGVYCGAIGWIDTERGAGDLAVAIRTFVSADGRTSLGVGGGIVADSDPGLEWDETELKVARLLQAAGAVSESAVA
jgi:para-aminobenzoate synthetase component 1